MGTGIKVFGALMLVGILSVIFAVTCRTCNTAVKMVDNAQKTVYEQFKPEELLRKYEWFKDASSQLDQKLATLKVYENKFNDLKQQYNNVPRNKWGSDDREQYNIWQSEQAGISASYNDLAAQYNSAMSKFNYRFCNKGDLPQGATEPLPREYKPYVVN
jgi:hypothetical protein